MCFNNSGTNLSAINLTTGTKKTIKRLMYLILDGTKDLNLKRNTHMDKK